MRTLNRESRDSTIKTVIVPYLIAALAAINGLIEPLHHKAAVVQLGQIPE